VPKLRPCVACGKKCRGDRCRDCWKLIARETNPRVGTRGVCSFLGCNDPHLGLGWCSKHYTRYRRHGDPGVNLQPRTGATRACPSCGKKRSKSRLGVCRACWRYALPKWIGCLAEGCPEPHASKGYCTKHAHRVRRYGDPDIVRLRSIQIVAQLPVPAGDCIEWPYVGRGGYGRAVVGNRSMPAHRFVWEEQVGPISPGLHLDHLCCNAACVNVQHLEPVTPTENQRRRWARWWARQAA